MEEDCWRVGFRRVKVACPAQVWSGGPVVLGRSHPDDHARGRMGHPHCRKGLLPPNARVVLREKDAAPDSGGLVGGGGGGGQAARSNTGRKNDLWTVCGRDGSERICKTLHLSDALGLKRVRSAQRDGKEANPWSPRVPRGRSATSSLAAKESTGSWSVTGDELEVFGRQVERLMRLPDVPRRQEGLVAGGLLALGRLAATIDPRRGLRRLTQALETISEEGLSQASEESYYDDEELEPVSLQLARRGLEKWERLRWRIPFGGVACQGTCCVRTKRGIRSMPVVYQWWTAQPWLTC